jgi:3-dehydroshikimate dehydratase
MKLSVCTISFRHHLISIEELARWAQTHGFQGIELWGAHAKNLALQPEYGAEWLHRFGLNVSMLSDYLPLESTTSEIEAKLDLLSRLARHWGAKKLRTFAGRVASGSARSAERRAVVDGLRLACETLGAQGLLLLVETHPHTLADSAASTLRLLSEVNHPALRVNFDVLHLWEAGDEPMAALSLLRSHVAHFHLKNVSSRELLSVFAPANVYSAAGSRRGMVPLFEGAFDYRAFLQELASDRRLEASLEWFGEDVKNVLDHDREALHELGLGRSVPRASGSESRVAGICPASRPG